MFAKFKQSWLEKQEEKFRTEFAQHLNNLQVESEEKLRAKKREIEDSYSKLDDMLRMTHSKNSDLQAELLRLETLRSETERERNSLKDQLKAIEAKAHPSTVWCEAFSLGFSKAWDMMFPIMEDGLLKVRKQIETQAVQNVLRRN